MSDWGQDGYEAGIEAEPVDVDDPAVSNGPMTGLDLTGLAGEVVDEAVKDAVRKKVDQLAAAAVDRALTPELVDSLRARAATAAAAAVTGQGGASPDGEPPAPGADGPPSAPTLYFGSVDEFVREYLCKVYRRRIDGRAQHRVWAAEWWKYDEAAIRLEALWRAWEHLRQDPATGMSVWWRDHADHHMGVLFDPESGPFGRVEGEQNSCKPGEPLPYAPPPPGMFPDVRQEQAHTG